MDTPFASRLERARAEMGRLGVDALFVGPGADLVYLTGYEALPLERMTLLVVPAGGDPRLVVPRLERPRAESSPARDVVEIADFGETDDPMTLVTDAVRGAPSAAAVQDRLWAMFVLRLQASFPSARFEAASRVMRALRIRKDAAEIELLRRAGTAADAVAVALQEEKVSGLTERELSRWISERLVEEGHDKVSFAIVASGPNAASPHHEPGERVIERGDSLVCDFGGTVEGYGSDITRTFTVGPAHDELAEIHAIVMRAQEEAVRAVRPGVSAESVDEAARRIIADAGYGEYFVHRTGHGIGLEEHEEPYIVSGNDERLEEGMAFSVEPGIYLPGARGVRIEDIVVCGADGPVRLNNAPRELIELG